MKKKKLKIGIVGCGAIGSSLARFISGEMRLECSLCALYDLDRGKSGLLAREVAFGKSIVSSGLSQLIRASDLVVEAASAEVSWQIASAAVRAKRDCLIMSVAGVSSRLRDLTMLARRYGAKVYIPSGAISGIDAVKASNVAAIKKVVLTTRKSPRSFEGVAYVRQRGVNLSALRSPTVLFSGPAADAVRYFPQNINVCAVLSLAGIGPDKTMVKIIAEPGLSRNIHEVLVESDAGTVMTLTENVLHPDNPKTSYLAVLSAAAMIKNIVSPVKVGT